jgi:hypothetical protein
LQGFFAVLTLANAPSQGKSLNSSVLPYHFGSLGEGVGFSDFGV